MKEEINKAEQITVNGEKGKMKEINKPEQITTNGEILTVDDVIVNGEKRGIMVKIFDVKTGKKIDAMTSEGMLDNFVSNGGKYRDLVKKGSTVTATLEVHKGMDLHTEDKATSYEDENGDVQVHKRSGHSIRELIPMGQFQSARFNLMNAEQAKVDVQYENMDRMVSKKMEILMMKGFDAETAAKLSMGVLG